MLTTITSVKARLGIDTADVKDDALLTNLIALVSARVENECNRTFGYAQNVTDDFEGDETELRVSHYPIDETQTVSYQLLTKASEGWQTLDQAEYVLRRKCVVSLLSRLGEWKMVLRLQYSGGYVLPDASSVVPGGSTPPNLPDDLQFACVEQITYWYQNKDHLGLKSITAGGQAGGSISHVGNLDLLPIVSATLSRYERFMN